MEILPSTLSQWLWMTRMVVKTCSISLNIRDLIKVVKWNEFCAIVILGKFYAKSCEWLPANNNKCFSKTCTFNCSYIQYIQHCHAISIPEFNYNDQRKPPCCVLCHMANFAFFCQLHCFCFLIFISRQNIFQC